MPDAAHSAEPARQPDEIQACDEGFMRVALEQAHAAARKGEVPVGAVVVKNGVVVATGHNAPVGGHDPTAHAEMEALRAAARVLGNYRLEGCTLYVTLEPCTMCSGAMLHARLDRVVFGAADPKTGAAGSVLNVFSDARLNHQTQVQGGVLAQDCGQLLQTFFQQRRGNPWPLREDALRTPEARFKDLPDYAWREHFIGDLPSLNGLRMHYLDEGPLDAPLTYLCLHSYPLWSYSWRKLIPALLSSGARVLAPDLVGFGKSDKPKKEHPHRFQWHRQVLLEWVERLDLRRVVLVLPGSDALLGLSLPVQAPKRYSGVLLVGGADDAVLQPGDGPTWLDLMGKHPEKGLGQYLRTLHQTNRRFSEPACAAYMAPFPDRGHCAALRAFPSMHTEASSENLALAESVRDFWRRQWQGQSMVAGGPQDLLLAEAALRVVQHAADAGLEGLRGPLTGCVPEEPGAQLAEVANPYFRSSASDDAR